MTLAGIRPAWPLQWRVARPRSGMIQPALQLCALWLRSDVEGHSGIQFLRLRWHCAALTICREHRVPLQQICSACGCDCRLVSKRTGRQRYQFFCECCGSSPAEHGFANEPGRDSIDLLARFESQLFRALAGRTVDWCWVGYAEPEEFVRLVEDLVWVLSRPSHDSRPIYELQASVFPLAQRFPPEGRGWNKMLPHVRRCMLAAALAVFTNPRARSILKAKGAGRTRWGQLVACLETALLDQLERRSWYWAAPAHNALRRAARSSASPPPITSRRKRGRILLITAKCWVSVERFY